MKKTHSTMVRLTEDQWEDLERIAKETDQDPAKLIRYAIDALFKHYERSGKRLVLPLDFSDTVQVIREKRAEKATAEKQPQAA